MRLLQWIVPRRFTAQLVLLVVGSLLVSQLVYTIHTAEEQGALIERVLNTQSRALAGNIAASAAADLVQGVEEHCLTLAVPGEALLDERLVVKNVFGECPGVFGQAEGGKGALPLGQVHGIHGGIADGHRR